MNIGPEKVNIRTSAIKYNVTIQITEPGYMTVFIMMIDAQNVCKDVTSAIYTVLLTICVRNLHRGLYMLLESASWMV